MNKVFIEWTIENSSGSSGWVDGEAKKHEIYVAAFGGHICYDLFLQGQGGHGPIAPWIRYWKKTRSSVWWNITCHRHLSPVSTIRPLCTQRQRRWAHTSTWQDKHTVGIPLPPASDSSPFINLNECIHSFQDHNSKNIKENFGFLCNR